MKKHLLLLFTLGLSTLSGCQNVNTSSISPTLPDSETSSQTSSSEPNSSPTSSSDTSPTTTHLR